MKIIIIGYGKMGHLIESTALSMGHTVAMAVDLDNIGDLSITDKIADVVMDFSSPSSLPAVAEYVKRTGTPYLCGATGHSPGQKAEVASLGSFAPVVHSANYSLGVAVFKAMLERFAHVLADDFDIEVTETHHNQKIDAPSGTAFLLLDAIDPEGEFERVYDRHAITGRRGAKEIGVTSRRGGTIAGEHTVSFFGQDEVLEITHKATSRQIFVNGALKAAQELIKRPAGFYTLKQLIFEE